MPHGLPRPTVRNDLTSSDGRRRTPRAGFACGEPCPLAGGSNWAGLGLRPRPLQARGTAWSIDGRAGVTYVAAPVFQGISMTLSREQVESFRTMLTEKRDEIVRRAEQTLKEDMTLDSDDLPDEMDLASSEYLQAFTFRLRGREKNLLDKIQKALERIDDGTFGICEECDEPISAKRLEARPETTLCIRCKEEQERVERDFS